MKIKSHNDMADELQGCICEKIQAPFINQKVIDMPFYFFMFNKYKWIN